MRKLLMLTLLIFYGCAQTGVKPRMLDGNPMAYDSAASGNVLASAAKVSENKDICFEISLSLKGVSEQAAMASNWTLTWVDQKDRHHLMKLNQRDPASTPNAEFTQAPYGAYQEWTNTFRTCINRTKSAEVKSLVLTPKELPFEEQSLILKWK
jgi:hypothetical protein